MDDEWVRERAALIAVKLAAGTLHRADIEAALQEAITRTREAERALAAEALKAALAMQEKAVAAAEKRGYDIGYTRALESREFALEEAVREGRQSLIARLKNPDEGLIEAASDAFYEALETSVAAKKAWNASMAERDLPYRKIEQSIATIEWLGPVIRALAATLDKEE